MKTGDIKLLTKTYSFSHLIFCLYLQEEKEEAVKVDVS